MRTRVRKGQSRLVALCCAVQASDYAIAQFR
jgi:hypothetical protein